MIRRPPRSTLFPCTTPSRSILFKLFSPADPTCSGTPASATVYSQSVTVNAGNGTYSTSPGYDRTSTRPNYCHAHYSYASISSTDSSLCAEEAVVLAQATPTIVTPPTPAPVFFFNDTATTEIYPLSLHPALPILFKLFSPADPTCSGTPASATVYSQSVTVNAGNGTYSTSPG